MHEEIGGEVSEKPLASLAIGGLTADQEERKRPTPAVGQRLRRPAAARGADGLAQQIWAPQRNLLQGWVLQQ
jgi:hypothetical protein